MSDPLTNHSGSGSDFIQMQFRALNRAGPDTPAVARLANTVSALNLVGLVTVRPKASEW